MDLREVIIVSGLVLLAAYKLHQAVNVVRGRREAEEDEKRDEPTAEKRVAAE